MQGKALELTLTCSIAEQDGKTVGIWYLLSNSDFDGKTPGRYYYFRWQIESYFKLLKSAGHHMEDWLQQTGEAFFKRALLVAQSCVLVWRLLHDHSPKAEELKVFLVCLSGRNTKRNKPITAPALLEGYLRLLSAHEMLSLITPRKIADYVRFFQYG